MSKSPHIHSFIQSIFVEHLIFAKRLNIVKMPPSVFFPGTLEIMNNEDQRDWEFM